MNKISKPPWRVESYLEPFDSVIKTWQVVSAEDLIVAKCGKGAFEIEANAKLISTAPDMMKMLEKMAEALEEIRRCVYKNKYSNYTLTDDFDPQVITKAIQEYREMRDAK